MFPPGHYGVALALYAVVGCALVVASSLATRPRRETVRGALWAFFLGSFAVAAHLLADLLNPWGVMPVYPLSPALYSLDLVRATDDAANYAMLALGVGVAALAWTAGRSDEGWPSLARRLYRKLRRRTPSVE